MSYFARQLSVLELRQAQHTGAARQHRANHRLDKIMAQLGGTA
jgi:hypothetical protein